LNISYIAIGPELVQRTFSDILGSYNRLPLAVVFNILDDVLHLLKRGIDDKTGVSLTVQDNLYAGEKPPTYLMADKKNILVMSQDEFITLANYLSRLLLSRFSKDPEAIYYLEYKSSKGLFLVKVCQTTYF
jgi:hypothetical protein